MAILAKQEHIEDEKHRRWLASLGCVVTGSLDAQVAHIRKNSGAGMGRKPSDNRCLPLSINEHRLQHKTSELHYWYPHGGWEKAVVLAKSLYAVTGNTEEALKLITEWRNDKQPA